MSKPNFLYVVTVSAICLTIIMAGSFLVRTAQPSADVIAAIEAKFPEVQVEDYEPGDVRIVFLDNLPIIVWRRDEADMALAAEQDDPKSWKVKDSKVLGHPERIYAEDKNLTLNGEWFFAVGEVPESRGHIALLRAGNFAGFFGPHHADHYDLAGRIRHQGRENLTIVSAEMSADKKTIQLDLRR